MDRKGGGKPVNIRNFVSIYKCRLCGGTFPSVWATNSSTAYTKLMSVAMYHSGINHELLNKSAPTLHGIHRCSDGSLGLGDLQGMLYVGQRKGGEGDG